MKSSTVVTLIVLGAAGGGGAWYFLREEPPAPLEVVSTVVRRSTIVRTVRAVGHVEPVTQVNVSSNVTGDLLKLLVKEGAQVTRGTLLAEIDRERILAVVRQNQANAQSNKASVDLEEAQLAQAQAEAQRTKGLHQKQLATDSELEQAASNVAIVKARLESARQRVAQAEAALDEAKDQLEKTRIMAPIDGTVISLKKKQGERIRGSDLGEDVLLTLAPLQAMQVDVEVSEQDVVGIEAGQHTEIEVDALGDAKFPGEVIEIASSAVIKNKGTEMEVTSFNVKVAMGQVPANLRSGMSASVSIITQVKENVIAVPLEAVTARLPSQLLVRAEEQAKEKRDESVFQKGGNSLEVKNKKERPVELVYSVESGKAEPKPVKTGIASESEIEILEGVEPGLEIITGPYKVLAESLLPGSPVTVTKKQEPTPDRVAVDGQRDGGATP